LISVNTTLTVVLPALVLVLVGTMALLLLITTLVVTPITIVTVKMLGLITSGLKSVSKVIVMCQV